MTAVKGSSSLSCSSTADYFLFFIYIMELLLKACWHPQTGCSDGAVAEGAYFYNGSLLAPTSSPLIRSSLMRSGRFSLTSKKQRKDHNCCTNWETLVMTRYVMLCAGASELWRGRAGRADLRSWRRERRNGADHRGSVWSSLQNLEDPDQYDHDTQGRKLPMHACSTADHLGKVMSLYRNITGLIPLFYCHKWQLSLYLTK